MLRQGAWYPVVFDGDPEHVVLGVERGQAVVPRRLLEIRTDRPKLFTIVRRGRRQNNPAHGTRADMGRTYAVCPISGHRVRLFGMPTFARCPVCGHTAEVAWWETG
jgi:hypothetical protein